MRRLFGVEFRRVFARDLTRLLGLIFVLFSVLGSIGGFVSTNSAPKEQETNFDQMILRERADLPARIEKCVTEGPDLPELPPEAARRGVADRQGLAKLSEPQPRPECRSTLSRSGFPEGDRRFHLISLPGILEGLIVPTAIFALIIGATMIGAEWGAGTIPTLLTWEPRRLRVLFAKILAVLGASASLFLLFALLVGMTLVPVLIFRGTSVGIDSIWREDLLSVGLRGMYLPAATGLFGFAIAMLIRNTAAALGAAFGYLFIVENLIRATGALHAWLVSSNAAIVLQGYSPFRMFPPDQEPVSRALVDRSSLEAGLILGGYMLLIALISGFLFHRRDVH